MSVAVGEVMAWEVRVNIKLEICWCMVQDFRCCEKKKKVVRLEIQILPVHVAMLLQY